MPSLMDLPVELMSDIAGPLDKPALLSLCLVSQEVRSVAIRPLYNSVHLDKVHLAARFFDGVERKRDWVRYIRSLDIAIKKDSAPLSPEAQAIVYHLSTKLAIAIAHVPTLETLRLHECYYKVSMNESLEQATLPCLKNFFYEESLDMPMALTLKFIERHPLLERLTIRNEIYHFEQRAYVDSSATKIRLPQLTFFEGPSGFIKHFDGPIPLKSIVLEWYIDKPDVEMTLRKLGTVSGQTLTSLACTVARWVPDFVAFVAQHLPRLQQLHVSNCSTRRLSNVKDELLTAVPKLEALVSLRLISLNPSITSFSSKYTRFYAKTAVKLQNACPNLDECTLYTPSGDLSSYMSESDSSDDGSDMETD